MQEDILPEKVLDHNKDRFGDRYSHPAFGVITMSHPVGGRTTLFGSDVQHPGTVSIQIKTAKLYRSSSRDWHSSVGGEVLVDFEMSHSQFVNFVSSAGRGEGTPITLRISRKGPVEFLPGIKMVEAKTESTKRQIEQDVAAQLEEIANRIAAIEAHLDSGKLSKKEIREQIVSMKYMVRNLPSNLGYAVGCAKEAVESMASTAKVDVEAFLNSRVRALGLNAIEDFKRLENKRED